MKLVKLDAIDSTNEYLKELVRKQSVENYSVVTAELQTKGKGQRGSTWSSEKGKNLILSMLVSDFVLSTTSIFELNIVVSLAVLESLTPLNIPKLAIKWPNDIMSDDKKIGGILIENCFKSDSSVDSVIGIGLNVNQLIFENLPQASSLALISGAAIDKDALLKQVVSEIEEKIKSWKLNAQFLRDRYTNLLFKKDEKMVFQDSEGLFFNGAIQGITLLGRLVIKHENGNLIDFDIKQVKMIF